MSYRDDLRGIIEFTTISATKEWLRELRDKGVTLTRNDEPAHFDPATRRINVPRGARVTVGPRGVRMAWPRESFWHEAGHAQAQADRKISKGAAIGMYKRNLHQAIRDGDVEKVSRKTAVGNRTGRYMRKQEILANRIAIERMKAKGVPFENIQEYRNNSATYLNDYRAGNIRKAAMSMAERNRKKAMERKPSESLKAARHGRGGLINQPLRNMLAAAKKAWRKMAFSYRDELNDIIRFNEGEYKLYYFKGRNTAVVARSEEEARSRKKRGGDEIVAVREPTESERKAMAAGRWVRTRRDGQSPEKSKYGRGRGYGPPRKGRNE